MPQRNKWISAGSTAATALLVATAFLAMSAGPANAAGKVTFAVDAPSVQGSFVAGVVLETFDDSCGDPIAFGSVSGACASGAGNYYSGASTTSSAPTQGGSPSPLAVVPMGGAATFTLDSPARYVGFHWEAGNEYDRVQLFSGDTMIADFSFGTLMAVLAGVNLESADGLTTYTVADYFGNPVNDAQPSEPYAYVHIFTSEGVTFDSVVFSEDAQSVGQFEFDNMAVLFANDGSIDDTTFDDVVELTSVNVGGSNAKLASTGAKLPDGVLFSSLLILGFAVVLRRQANRI
jgi:hypothetical protein